MIKRRRTKKRGRRQQCCIKFYAKKSVSGCWLNRSYFYFILFDSFLEAGLAEDPYGCSAVARLAGGHLFPRRVPPLFCRLQSHKVRLLSAADKAKVVMLKLSKCCFSFFPFRFCLFFLS